MMRGFFVWIFWKAHWYILLENLFNDELLDGKEYKLKIKTNNFSGISVGKNQFDPI